MRSRITKAYLRQTKRGAAEILWCYIDLPEEPHGFAELFLQLLEYHLMVIWTYRAELDRRHFPGGRWAKAVSIDPPVLDRTERRVSLSGTVTWRLGYNKRRKELRERFRWEYELERTPTRRDKRRFRLVGEVRSMR